jgi:hypothetical protein
MNTIASSSVYPPNTSPSTLDTNLALDRMPLTESINAIEITLSDPENIQLTLEYVDTFTNYRLSVDPEEQVQIYELDRTNYKPGFSPIEVIANVQVLSTSASVLTIAYGLV